MRRIWGVVIVLAACGGGGGGSPDAGADAMGDDVDASGGPLIGDPDDPAIAALPDIAFPSPPTSYVDVEGALRVSDRRLVIALADTATIGAVNAVIAASGGALVGANPETGLVAIDLPEGGDASAAADLADDDPATVIAAVPELFSPPLRIPAQLASPIAYEQYSGCSSAAGQAGWTGAGANWGLAAARVPVAWNLIDRLRRGAAPPDILVIDVGFDPDHPDVPFATGTADGAVGEEDGSHGNAVASAIAARWDGVGVSGAYPSGPVTPPRLLGQLRDAGGFLARFPELNDLDAFTRASRAGGKLIGNYSQGQYYTVDDPDRRPGAIVLWRIESASKLWDTAMRRLVYGYGRHVLIVCSAGNDGATKDLVFTAAMTSGCSRAAVTFGTPGLLSVESLAYPGDAIADASNRGAQLAAGGDCVGLASDDGAYAVDRGSSFAAPLVAGAAALAWTLAPDADTEALTSALLMGAQPGAGGSAPRLDLPATLALLTPPAGTPPFSFDRADLDDGTADGNVRLDPQGTVVLPPEVRGDGCVDLADLRAMRDAIIAAADPATTELDGGGFHLARDLDGNGYVFNGATPPTGAPPDDARFARFDLDGNGSVDEGDLVDLVTHWGTCRADATTTASTEGWSASEVLGPDGSSLLATVDLWIPVFDGVETMVWATGSRPRWIGPTSETYTVGGERYAIVTAPVSCGGLVPPVACRQAAGATPGELLCEELTAPMVPGNDLVVSPDTSLGVGAGALVFIGESAIDAPNPIPDQPGRFAAGSTGLVGPTDYDVLDHGEELVTPAGELAFYEACHGGIGWTCLEVVDPSDLSLTTMAPSPVVDELELLTLDATGRYLLVRTERGSTDRLWEVSLDAVAACAQAGCTWSSVATNRTPAVAWQDGAAIAYGPGGTIYVADDATPSIVRLPREGHQVGQTCELPALETVFDPADDLDTLILDSNASPIAADGSILATRKVGATWDIGVIRDGAWRFVIGGYPSIPRFAAAFGEVSEWVLVRSPTGAVAIFHVSLDGSLSVLRQLAASGWGEAGVAFAPGALHAAAHRSPFVVGGASGELIVWDTFTGAASPVRSAHGQSSSGAGFSADGEEVVYVRENPDAARDDLDIVRMDVTTYTVTEVGAYLQPASCAPSPPPACPYADQVRPRWGRQIRTP